MALSSGGIAQFSSGAGRSYQNVWPPTNDGSTGGSGPTANQEVRTGNSPNGISVGTATTGSVQYQAYKAGAGGALVVNGNTTEGNMTVRINNVAAGDLAKAAYNQGFTNRLEIDQLPATIQPDRFFRVGRFIVRAAFPTLAGALNLLTADLGLMVLPGNTANMNNGGNRPGIQMGPTDAAKFTIRTRKSFAAAYDFQQDFTYAQLGVASLDAFITYEIRIISADSSTPGRCKFFFNEVQIGPTINFGAADGRLPGIDAAGGGFLGLIPSVIATNVGNYGFFMKYMSLIFTTDEQGNI